MTTFPSVAERLVGWRQNGVTVRNRTSTSRSVDKVSLSQHALKALSINTLDVDGFSCLMVVCVLLASSSPLGTSGGTLVPPSPLTDMAAKLTNKQQLQLQAAGGDAGSPLNPLDGPTAESQTSLFDIVKAELIAHRNPERPILSRMALVGEAVSKDDPVRPFFEECATVAAARINADDPFGGKSSLSNDPVTISGFLIDMTGHFFLLVESEPAHLVELTKEVHDRLHVRRAFEGARNVAVAFSVDDVVARSLPASKIATIEAALPPSQSVGTKQLEECVVDAVQGLMQLGKHCANHSKLQMESFLQSARTTHANLIPRSNLVEKLLESGMCPTLQEYVGLFGSMPVVRRPTEMVFPMEPPVVY